jgi:acetolactate decarboxylase
MHKNDLTAKADLSSLAGTPHVYALGALENLKGELLIWDGQPFISQQLDSFVTIEHSLDYQAALLVYSSVQKWEEIEIPDNIFTYQDLEEFILQTAISRQLDTALPFPFLVKGKVQGLNWHVINWPDGDSVHTHQKHKTSGAYGKILKTEVDILGFYSAHHHAIFTHHSTNMHMHVKTKDGKLAGHVDDLEIGKMTLYIPKLDTR